MSAQTQSCSCTGETSGVYLIHAYFKIDHSFPTNIEIIQNIHH